MSAPYAAGDNFRIVVDGGRATVTIWRRPDLDSATGARNANEMAAHVRTLTPEISALMLDLREAPLVAGPKTVDTLSELLRGCEKAGVPVAVVLSGDAMQLLQFRRLVTTYAPTRGKVAVSTAEADAHLARKASSRR